MGEILYLICPSLGGLLLFSMAAEIIPLRYCRWSLLGVVPPTLLLSILKFVFGSRSLAGELSSLISTLAVCFLIPLIIFVGPKWKRIMVTLFFFAVQLIADMACYSFFSPQYGPMVEDYPEKIILVYVAVSLGLYALIGSFCVLMFRSVSLRKFQPYYLVFLAFLFSQIMAAFWNLYPEHSSGFWLISLLMSLAADMALLDITIAREKRVALEEELQSVRHTMTLEQQHYQAMEERREKLAHIRHDFNNQLAVIGQLVRNGDEEDAQRMIQSLSEEISQTRENPYCHIPVVNAVLSEKTQECRQAGITLVVDLKLPSVLEIEPLKLCSVFSNLLDNAIQGARDTGKKETVISLTAKTEGDYLFVKAINPALSAKRQSSPGHGYGLRILRDIAKQYKGEHLSYFEDGVYTAIITLLLSEA